MLSYILLFAQAPQTLIWCYIDFSVKTSLFTASILQSNSTPLHQGSGSKISKKEELETKILKCVVDPLSYLDENLVTTPVSYLWSGWHPSPRSICFRLYARVHFAPLFKRHITPTLFSVIKKPVSCTRFIAMSCHIRIFPWPMVPTSSGGRSFW